jgi:hypothetical protein
MSGRYFKAGHHLPFSTMALVTKTRDGGHRQIVTYARPLGRWRTSNQFAYVLLSWRQGEPRCTFPIHMSASFERIG